MKSPIHPKHPDCDKYLNKKWLSVPHGSETNFIVTAKNTYEENLFKVILNLICASKIKSNSSVKMKDMSLIIPFISTMQP